MYAYNSMHTYFNMHMLTICKMSCPQSHVCHFLRFLVMKAAINIFNEALLFMQCLPSWLNDCNTSNQANILCPSFLFRNITFSNTHKHQ